MNKINNSRLIIKTIELENFKSYYGHHKIGPLNNKINAIIGPNGCGKSNLIDALIFLFGKRASWMRLKYYKDLIHHSANHTDCDQALVKITLAIIPK